MMFEFLEKTSIRGIITRISSKALFVDNDDNDDDDDDSGNISS